MKQFGKILKFELKYYFKNKVFVGVTVFLGLLICAVMFFPRILEPFEREDADDGPRPVMLIRTDREELAPVVQEAFSAAFADYEVRTTDLDSDTLQQEILQGEAACAFEIRSLTAYTYLVDNLSMYDMNTAIADEVLQSTYRFQTMLEQGLSPEQAEEILTAPIDSQTVSLGKDQFQNYFYTYIMIFALYMVILLYGQMVATNVASEKSSRAMELLITSADPTGMMFGKVIASCIAGLVQLIAVFGSALCCYALNRSYWSENEIVASIFDMPPELFAYMLVFFLLGFLIYAFLYGAIGSTASKLEDINTAVMPVTMLFIIAFFVVVFSLSANTVDTLLMRVCSFVPFTSPMAMFTRIAMSTVPWYEILTSVVILIGSAVGVGVLAAKIYRVGVLLYGNRPKLGSLLRSVFSK